MKSSGAFMAASNPKQMILTLSGLSTHYNQNNYAASSYHQFQGSFPSNYVDIGDYEPPSLAKEDRRWEAPKDIDTTYERGSTTIRQENNESIDEYYDRLLRKPSEFILPTPAGQPTILYQNLQESKSLDSALTLTTNKEKNQKKKSSKPRSTAATGAENKTQDDNTKTTKKTTENDTTDQTNETNKQKDKVTTKTDASNHQQNNVAQTTVVSRNANVEVQQNQAQQIPAQTNAVPSNINTGLQQTQAQRIPPQTNAVPSNINTGIQQTQAQRIPPQTNPVPQIANIALQQNQAQRIPVQGYAVPQNINTGIQQNQAQRIPLQTHAVPQNINARIQQTQAQRIPPQTYAVPQIANTRIQQNQGIRIPAQNNTQRFPNIQQQTYAVANIQQITQQGASQNQSAGHAFQSVRGQTQSNGKAQQIQNKAVGGISPTAKLPKLNLSNPVIFLDMDIDDEPRGRLVVELFQHALPKTSQNFLSLCLGDRGFGYKHSYFHRIIPNFMAQGGDFENSDGTGGYSIYGPKFNDEGFPFKHDRAGLLSMANSGPNTNGSQFFFTFGPAPHLDGKHTVFGQVLSGYHLLDDFRLSGSESGEPIRAVKIADCGQVQ